MAISAEQNDLMTRVEGDAPLGKMLRQHYWIPVIPSAPLAAGGAPVRVRLVGYNYVVWRTDDGRVGVFDEQCPHRLASLALGHNRDNSLSCVYHGWRFAVDGTLLEAPNHNGDQTHFCKSVKFNRYEVVERGGIVWVWLGGGDCGSGPKEKAPPFPDLPFTRLPEENRSVTSNIVPTNFLQGVEASMDSSHVSFLHESTTMISSGSTQRAKMTVNRAPSMEFEMQPYGFQYAALRPLPDGKVYARVNHFVMPWYGVICAPEENGPATVFFSVSIDDTHHRAWFVHYNIHKPLGMTALSASPDLLNWPPLPPGAAKDNWGQARDLMQRGHASGFPQHLATEDFAVFLSQGAILDRTAEQMCSGDAAVVRVRLAFMRSIGEFQKGSAPVSSTALNVAFKNIHSVGGLIDDAKAWRELVAKVPDYPAAYI
jgi:phthalate 4,5-dioxygenase